jgi:hypothetical protein
LTRCSAARRLQLHLVADIPLQEGCSMKIKTRIRAGGQHFM